MIVAIHYESLWFPGKISAVHDDDTFDVSCMEYMDKFELTNKFRWPSREDVKKHDREDLLLKLEEPKGTGTGKRLLHFALNNDDINHAGNILNLILN